VGVLCSVFLFPAYKYGASNDTMENMGNITARMEAQSLSNVPSGHYSTIATTLAANIFYGVAMYFIANA
jgi:hypothetical protein